MAAPHSLDTAETRLLALRRKPRGARRLAVLADAELDPAFAVVAALAAAGYGVTGLTGDAAELGARLEAAEGEAIMLNDYAAFYATLPAALRDAVAARWGAAERDPHYRSGQVDCGRFVVPVLRLGAVAVIASADEIIDPPRHYVLARLAWITDVFRADAAIAWRPLGAGLPVPVLTSAADTAASPAGLLAALDGDVTASRQWRAL